MAAGTRVIARRCAFVAAGLTALVAQAREPTAAPMPRAAYHVEVRTAVRQDPPAVAHAPAWGSWADAPGAWADAPSATPADIPSTRRNLSHRRPDPNLRVRTPTGDVEIPGPAPFDHLQAGGDGRWDGVRTPDDRARHGWRAGWHGAAPGWGGVWWYGWGGDWPTYAMDGGAADGWSRAGTLRVGYGHGREGWHRGFEYSQGWGAGRAHGMFGFGHDHGGGHVIALPAARGE